MFFRGINSLLKNKYQLRSNLILQIMDVFWESGWQVKFCRSTDGISQRLDYEGMENGVSYSELCMKEIVSTVVTKRAKLTVSRNNNPIEMVR